MKFSAFAVASFLALMSCGDVLMGDGNGQPQTADQARAYLSNKTNLFQYADGTTELEYTAADGKSYYWVPENKQMVVGSWRVAERDGSYEICFRYPTGAIEYYGDQSTTDNWGFWNCTPGNDILNDGLERADGNPLGLKEGAVPFSIPRETAYNLATLASQIGVDPSSIRYLPVYQNTE